MSDVLTGADADAAQTNERAMQIALGLIPLLDTHLTRHRFESSGDLRGLFYRLSCLGLLSLQRPFKDLLPALSSCLSAIGCNVTDLLARHSIVVFGSRERAYRSLRLALDCVLLFAELIRQHLSLNGFAFAESVLTRPAVLALCYKRLSSDEESPAMGTSLRHYFSTVAHSIEQRSIGIQTEPTAASSNGADAEYAGFKEWSRLLLSVWRGGGLFSEMVDLSYSASYAFPKFSTLIFSERYSFSPSIAARDEMTYRAFDACKELSTVARQLLRLSNLYNMSLPNFETELFTIIKSADTGARTKSLTPFDNLPGATANASAIDINAIPLSWLPSCIARLVNRSELLKWSDRKLLANFLCKTRPGRNIAQVETELRNYNWLLRENGRSQSLHSNTVHYFYTYSNKSATSTSLADSIGAIKHCSTLIDAARNRWRLKIDRAKVTQAPSASSTQDIEDLLTADMKFEAECPIAYQILDGNTSYSIEEDTGQVHVDFNELDTSSTTKFNARVIRACAAASLENVSSAQSRTGDQSELRVNIAAATPVSLWISYGLNKNVKS